ncbi:MAG: DUF58 domain-containing protein, partial [Schleiferiaceae bacterium]|nr:DUF58 domain-containing protein [Schleiferiaceae bacterium]
MNEQQFSIDTAALQQFGGLEFLAKQVVEGFITGMHKSPYHGFSVEFAEHRLYNKGESTRHIDWKLFAKTDKLFVKRYEEETNLRCQVLVDTSASMHFPTQNELNWQQPNKIAFSVLAAAAIMQLLKKQRDAVGLSTFADAVEVHTQARTTQTHHALIYKYLEQALALPEKRPDAKTNVTAALHQIAERLHRRSLVVLFSDMLDTDDTEMESIFQALNHFKYNKHEVVFFHTHDKRLELDFEFENRPYKFVDLETGETLQFNPADIREEVVL